MSQTLAPQGFRVRPLYPNEFDDVREHFWLKPKSIIHMGALTFVLAIRVLSNSKISFYGEVLTIGQPGLRTIC